MTKGRTTFPTFVTPLRVATISAACALLVACGSSRPSKSVASASENPFDLSAEKKNPQDERAPLDSDHGHWLEAAPPIVFGPNARRAILYDAADDAWPVSLEQAQTADGVMQIVLVQQRPDIAFHIGNYFGEFSGRTIVDPAERGDRRVVRMQFFCAEYLAFMVNSAGADPAQWMRLALGAQQDGGSCFFHADFDPITGAITDFSVNPE